MLADMHGKIVVIDDDELIRQVIALHLRAAGYVVYTAEDAVEGGHAILRERPDVIVCDVNMPYLNGYDLAAALKADAATSDIPIIFVTSEDDGPQQAAKLGAAACLRKPVRADRLLAAVALYTPLPKSGRP